MAHQSDYCEGICYDIWTEETGPDANEYKDMIADLRSRFSRTDMCTFPFGVQIGKREIKLRFQHYMQYLVEVEGIVLSGRARNYRHMDNFPTFERGRIASIEHLDTGRITPAAAPEEVRALVFITSEASRFHMISRGVFMLLAGQLNSINYTRCTEMITAYRRIRDAAGIAENAFRPIMDQEAHAYLAREVNGGQPRIDRTANVRQYMYG